MTRLSLTFRDWPSDWRARWLAAVTPAKDVFDEDGLSAHWAPDAQVVIRKRLETFFGYLLGADMLDPSLPLEAFLTEDALRPWINSLQERVAPTTVYGYVRDARLGICAMDPTSDTGTACLVARRLERRARPTRDEEKCPIHPQTIYQAGKARMDRVDGNDYEKEDVRAVQYGDGLAMMIAAASLVRVKNLVEMRVGQELRRIGDCYRLDFPGEQMKSRRPFAADLPSTLTPYVDNYINRHRTHLLQGRKSDHLFISCYRGPMSRQTMRLRFKAATKTELGIAICPHRVRKIAVTRIATDFPEMIGIAPGLLNHANERTSREHYNQACQLSAGRDYNAAVCDLRDEALLALREGALFDPD